MKQRLSAGNKFLMGFTLFSMFFGAGNLIFPPFIGALAGRNMGWAMAGFCLSAVGLPVLGVVAVSLSGNLESLAAKVHPKFAVLFSVLVYLSIGPFLAIPRTAGTSYEMIVRPFLGTGAGEESAFFYSLAFFGLAVLWALRPERLTERLGKMMTPFLLFLIFLIFMGGLFWPVGAFGQARAPYQSHAMAQGFLAGYQTMDTMAALNFGIIIALNIREKGVREPVKVIKETMLAGLLAGGMLIAVYMVLGHIGATAGSKLSEVPNGAQVLTFVVDELYGRNGLIILGVIFFIACFNVCVGLLCSCSKYFSQLIPKIPYPAWLLLFAGLSMGIANFGLTRILAASVPVLGFIYPVAIVLIFLGLFSFWLEKFPLVYPIAILFTAAASLLQLLEREFGLFGLAQLSNLVVRLPFYSLGFGWLGPALLGLAAGILGSCVRKN